VTASACSKSRTKCNLIFVSKMSGINCVLAVRLHMNQEHRFVEMTAIQYVEVESIVPGASDISDFVRKTRILLDNVSNKYDGASVPVLF
jgi:hypothetical protein